MPLSLTIHVFGLQLLSIEASTDEAEVEAEDEPPKYEPIAGLGAIEATPISFESRAIDSRQTEPLPAHDPWEWLEDGA